VYHILSRVTPASRRSSLLAPKRSISVVSWPNALTTRMPLIESLSTALSRERRSKNRCSSVKSRGSSRRVASTSTGMGARIHIVSQKLLKIIRALTATMVSTDMIVHGTASTMKCISSPVSWLTRVITAPVWRRS